MTKFTNYFCRKVVVILGTSERRFELIKVICLRKYEKMENLAFEFGVSKRTIQRDIDEITTIIPIYLKTGRYGGGVYLMDDFKFNNIYFNNDETILLKKICSYFKTIKSDLFEEKEIETFEKIIEKYSLPKTKADICCPF